MSQVVSVDSAVNLALQLEAPATTSAAKISQDLFDNYLTAARRTIQRLVKCIVFYLLALIFAACLVEGLRELLLHTQEPSMSPSSSMSLHRANTPYPCTLTQLTKVVLLIEDIR